MALGLGNRTGSGSNKKNGGGSSGGGKVASSTSTSLPNYISGAYDKLIHRTMQASKQPFKPYPKSPLAAESPMVGQAYNALSGYMKGGTWDDGYNDALGIYGGVDNAANRWVNNNISYNGPAGYNASQFSNQTVNPMMLGNQADVFAQQVAAGEWGSDQADRYMNPYIQDVLDVNKNQALLDFRRMQPTRNDAAIQAGSFGGSRHGVVDALAQEALMRNMSDIQAKGMNDAWIQAMQGFQSDRDAALQAGISNQAASLSAAQGNQQAGLQTSLANQKAGLDAALANQQANLEAQRQSELSRQYGYTQSMTQADRRLEAQKLRADASLRGLQAQLDAAGGINSAANNRNQAIMSLTQGLNQFGLQQTARDQALKDFKMQNYYAKRDNKKNNIAWASGILNGVPVTTQQTNSTYVNPYSQFLGIASAGLGAYNTFFNNNGGGSSGGTLY